jgi:hypothetical protein
MKYYGDEVGNSLPADLEKTNAAAAASAASTSKDSYTEKITLRLVKDKQYKFWFKYKYEDPETKEVKLSDSSPIWKESFTIPNLTKAVKNLTLTSGFKSYGVKFDLDPTSVQEDVVILESLTSDFAVQNIVYVGTSTNVTIQASSYAPRWVKVRSRDRWDDLNISEATAGPVIILNSEIDTTKVPKAPTGVSVTPSIDPEDKSGFSIKIDVSWTASTDADTNGYVIRWSANNPANTANPLWEYGQVDGKATTTFSITGLTPNTVYYWQVTAKSPFNSISCDTTVPGQVASGSFGPVSDPNAPAGNVQLRSILSIGGKTADLFKIGTGITQSINTSTTITPTQTAGTYNGIILDRSTTNFGHNYWLNTGQFRVGSATSFLYWDGSDVYTTGKINATGGVFTGNLRVTTGSIIAGGTFAQDGTVSGARVVMQSGGLYAHSANGEQSVFIQASDGLIDARKGYIGGWTLNATSTTDGYIQGLNTKIESNGTITLGDTSGTLASIVRLSANDPTYRIWIGSQNASNAKFKVAKDGTLYATGAVLGLGAGSTIEGYATTGSLDLYTLKTVTSGINTRLTDAEGTLAGIPGTISTLSSGLATKNTIFVTTDSTQPFANRAGDLWINGGDQNTIWTAYAAGQNWTEKPNTKLALQTSLNAKLNASAYVVQSSVDNKISADAAGFEIYSGSSNSASGSGVKITSTGLLGYKNGVPTFTITSAGDATFAGELKAGSGYFGTDYTNGFAISGNELIGNPSPGGGVTQIILNSQTGAISGGKITGATLAGNTITGGTITGSTIQTSTSSTNVKLQNSGVDSLQVTLSGTTVGHIYGVLAGGTTSAIIMQGGSSAPSSSGNTFPRAYIGSSVVSIAADASTSILLNSIDNTTKLFGNGGIYTDTVGSFYMRSGDTTAATANMQIVSTAGTTFGRVARSTSSRRYKTDIETVSYPDESVKLLRPVKYHGIKDIERGDNTWYTGLIAEEVAEIPGLELLVQYNDEGQPEAVNYAGLSVVLAEVVSRILNRLDALEAK